MRSDATSRRTALAEQLADRLLVAGIEQATLKALATSLVTSDRMLLYYFEDKADLMTAALEVLVARILGMLEAALPPPGGTPLEIAAHLTTIMLSHDARPYGRLWLEIVARAGRDDPVCAPIGNKIATGLLAWTEAHAHSDNALDVLRQVEGAVLLDAVGLR